MKYAVCPHCGAHLDFGERCDCEEQSYRAIWGKKEQPTSENVSRPKSSTPIVPQETSDCNRRS